MIDNAIKYSRDTPCVRSHVSNRGDIAEVSIQDKGLGLAADDLPKLFMRFGRHATPDNTNISGTGLGLYISRALARLHGGDISVSSELGGGSTFILWLRLATPTARPA